MDLIIGSILAVMCNMRINYLNHIIKYGHHLTYIWGVQSLQFDGMGGHDG